MCVIPCHPCMRTCVWLLEWSLLTRLSTSLSSSSSSSTRCPTQRLMRSPSKIPCATPAWGSMVHSGLCHTPHRNESHRDPEYIDFSVPRLERYMHKAWKRHQDAVCWVDIDLGIIKEGLPFFQTRSNAIVLQGTLPAHCIVKVERLKNGERNCMKNNTCVLVHHRRSL